MVTYGPWQDSRIHEELFTLKTTEDGDKTHELLGEEPTTRSGWDANNLAHIGWSSLATATGAYEQEEPPAPDATLSATAFAEVFSTNVIGPAANLQFQMVQTGDQSSILVPPRVWTQVQEWELRGAGYRLWFDPELEGDTRGTRFAIPPGTDSTDEYYIELEPQLPGADRVELVEVTVLASVGAHYRLYVKDAAETVQPFLYSATAQGGATTSINGAKVFPDADEDLPLDHATLNDLAQNGSPYVGDWSRDGRMPTMSILYDGPDLATATLGGEAGTDVLQDGQPVRIRIRYRWPRWRKVYYTAPYRRITNRKDARAGGARRVGQQPKTIQGSNRRGPGAIV